MNSKIILLICLVLSVPSAIAQNISNKGKDFWVGYGHHQFMETGANDMNMVLYLSAEDQPATVTVTIDSSSFVPAFWWRRTYTIPAYTVIATDIIPKGVVDAVNSGSDPNFDARLFTDPPPAGTGGAGLFRKKGIHIESNVPIVAYAHIYGNTSSGATVLLPTDAWGYSYVSLNTNQSYQSNCYNWLYVIAAKDNTVVEITPSVLTRAQDRTGLQPGQPTTVTLMKGQIYQVIAANDNADGNGNGGNSSEGRNLSGTKVRSLAGTNGDCFPIAVFAGSSRTSNPISCGSGGGDNDNQQLFPQHAWGKKYLTAPFSTDNDPSIPATSLYRIAVKDQNTQVFRNGTQLTGLKGLNNYYEFESNQPEYIEADKPIQVVQYMTGGNCINNGDGDPEMVVLAPIEQAIKKVGFFRNNKEFININYLTLIVPSGGTGYSSLLIGGNNNFSHVYDHPRLPGYKVVVKRWPTGGSAVPPLGQCLVTCDSAFTAITYGLGGAESYAYNAGAYLNNLNAIGSIHNEPDTANGGKNSHLFTCVNTPLKLSVLMRYQPLKLVFDLDVLGTAVTPNTDVTLDPASAAYEGIVSVSGVDYHKYTLPGSYTFNTPGTHRIPIKSTSLTIDNCNNTEDLNISVEVRAQPSADFTFSFPSGCLKDSVFITGPANASSYTVGQWHWSFTDATIDSVQHPHKAFKTPGNHEIKLDVVSTDGCIATVTKPVVVHDVPSASIAVNPASVCEGSTLTFTPTSNYTGPGTVNKYYWDFDNGNTISTSTGVQSSAYPNYGTYTVRLVTKVTDLCVSDTAETNVSVYAKPKPGVDFAGGCLAPGEAVTFTDTTKTPDGQAITAWSWNFGDPNATPANNVSTLQNPTHSYSDLSLQYNVTFRATTANGCFKDTVYKASFKAKPVLAFAALTPVCEDVTGTVSVAKGSLVNSVTGTGRYRGPATTSNGTFTPSQAGPGTHTIWYIYEATNGCKDSVSQTITVYAKPVTDFTVSANTCLNQPTTFDDNSTVPGGGAIASWKWDFGDGNNATYTNGNTFTRTYGGAATYTVKLITTTANGCTSEKSQSISINHLPITAFEVPDFICLPGGVAEFNNNSVIPGSGLLSYEWNFGDGSAISTDKDPAHEYATAGTYTITLTATSVQGCSFPASMTLDASIFHDKPTASFTVAPDKLCQGSDNTFTDQSTPGADINKWEWHFGDGTTSDQQNPVKRYKSPDKYNVTLQVTNSVGCESSPFAKEVNVYLQPVIEAGDPIVVPQGTLVTFKAKANDEMNLQFLWTPAAGLSDPTAIRPSLIATRDQVYKLVATGENDCTAEDELSVKILRPVNVPNAFSPNGDGINDRWQLSNLADYPGATVEVFNRYGQRVFYSNGYTNSWDGTVSGKPLPVATYYYIIHLKNGFKPITGSVTIVK